MKKVLPIGSVVTLEGGTKSLMIIGIYTVDKDENKEYDYVGCPFPEGYIDSDTFFLFNHEDIAKVEYLGFINAEVQAYMELMNREILEREENRD